MSVPATADIFAAGDTVVPNPPGGGGGGSLPPSWAVIAGATVNISASGSTSCCGPPATTPPDGDDSYNTDLDAFGGISGIVMPSGLPLVGVFTGDTVPASSPPASLDFTPSDGMTEDFTSLAPALDQTFFIGDGVTSSGAIQQFYVPAGATHLYLGFADGFEFSGGPGQYSDNVGGLTATVTGGIPRPGVNPWTQTTVDASGAMLGDVSCASPTFCAVADNGSVATFDGTQWTPSSEPVDQDGALALSCPASFDCVGVDQSGNADIYGDHAWVQQAGIDGQRALSAVACAGIGACYAVDDSGNVVLDDRASGSAWGSPQQIDRGRPLTAISCDNDGMCAAVGVSGEVVMHRSGVWQSPQDIDGTNALTSVSCPADQFCVAVGQSQALVYDGSGWSDPLSIDPGEMITSVSCPSVSLCVAVDDDGNAIVDTDGRWAPPLPIDASALTSVSCVSGGFCAAADDAGDVLIYDPNGSVSPSTVIARNVRRVATQRGTLWLGDSVCDADAGICMPEPQSYVLSLVTFANQVQQAGSRQLLPDDYWQFTHIGASMTLPDAAEWGGSIGAFVRALIDPNAPNLSCLPPGAWSSLTLARANVLGSERDSWDTIGGALAAPQYAPAFAAYGAAEGDDSTDSPDTGTQLSATNTPVTIVYPTSGCLVGPIAANPDASARAEAAAKMVHPAPPQRPAFAKRLPVYHGRHAACQLSLTGRYCTPSPPTIRIGRSSIPRAARILAMAQADAVDGDATAPATVRGGVALAIAEFEISRSAAAARLAPPAAAARRLIATIEHAAAADSSGARSIGLIAQGKALNRRLGSAAGVAALRDGVADHRLVERIIGHSAGAPARRRLLAWLTRRVAGDRVSASVRGFSLRRDLPTTLPF